MGNKSKQKGSRFERLCVKIAKSFGIKSLRAWGSDGRSLGEHSEVDIMVGEFKAQCKTRERIAKWIKPSKYVDIQIVKENYGEVYVIQKYENWLKIISKK
jgi:Holliday junction resolvase|tara:strand:+ start:2256 stop:2555 length:300 start_codon:yes stop_codon:yes gene_type:complete